MCVVGYIGYELSFRVVKRTLPHRGYNKGPEEPRWEPRPRRGLVDLVAYKLIRMEGTLVSFKSIWFLLKN